MPIHDPCALLNRLLVIAESFKLGRIAPADPDQGKRNARYVPYWAA